MPQNKKKEKPAEPSEEWEKRFDLGCNTDNISDPPTDTKWIKSFIRQLLVQAKQESYQQIIDSLREWAEEEKGLVLKGSLADDILSDLLQKLDELQKAEKYDCKR